MIFVPLPLFAVLILVAVLAHFIATRDMRIQAHQLFALLIGLYALQSFLVTLRWGYGVEEVTLATAILAPALPVLAYHLERLSSEDRYRSLVNRFGVRRTSPIFWQHSDKVLEAHYAANPLENGLLDYNRIENR